MRSKRLLILAILLLAIGFATVSTLLYFNGSANIAANIEDYDIYFSKSTLDNEDISNESISTDGKRIDFKTNVLTYKNDYSILKFEITNNSSMYDARVEIKCTPETNETYEISFPENMIVRAKNKEEGSLTIALKHNVEKAEELLFECALKSVAEERTSKEEEPIENNTYSFYGYLTDDEGNILPNKTMVMYSNPKYITTDDRGYFYVEGIESGTHELYYLGDITKSELESLSKEKIKEQAITNINITTSSKNVRFKNDYYIKDNIIEKTNNDNYEIEFDLNGYEGEEISKNLTQNGTYGELPVLTREGYDFLGWYVGDYEIKSGDLVINNEPPKAKWEAHKFTLSFDSVGGSSVEPIEIEYDSKYNNLPDSTLEGYTLEGWYTDTNYLEKITNETIVKVTESQMLYARWEANKYEVTFNANGGSEVDGIKVVFDSKYGSLPTSIKTGYSLTWCKDNELTDCINNETIVKTSRNHTLYAKWEANKYGLTYNVNGGKEIYEGKDITYDQTFGELPTPTRDGYTFIGWYTGISDGEEINSETVVKTTDPITIYARWEANTYTVTFNANGGSEVVTIETVTYDSPYGFTMPTTYKENYELVGWFIGDEEITGTAIVKILTNTVLNAKWQEVVAPTLTGGNTTWTNNNVIIKTSEAGTSFNQIDHYDYYLTQSSTLPTKETIVTGTTQDTLTISETGKWYIYYRTVTIAGNYSEWSNQVIAYVDKSGPVIDSITPQSTPDQSNYVSFSATDSNSKIAYYNVSSSSTAPTTWIPVNDFVEESTQTKYDKSAAWAQIYYHHSNKTNLFVSSEEALSSNNDYKYSVLGNIANYKNSAGKFEFMLEYPDYSLTEYNRWIQTGNPITEVTENTTEGTGVASGYAPIHIDWDGMHWGGLNLSTVSDTFIDGGVGHSTWYYAIAPFTYWQGNIPGPHESYPIGIAKWWARIDDKTRATKETLNARVGNITSNGIYYLHVKDDIGNITTKSFTISNIKDYAIEAPFVTGGNTTTWATSKTLTLTTPFSIDGITKYEYYVSDSNTVPASTVTPTGSITPVSSVTIKNTGKYIFFRSVNKNGLNSYWSMAFNLYVDSSGPVIDSITPQSTPDQSNYISFKATDTKAQVAYYNVSSSSTAPTTWIPVNNFVEDTTQTKYDKDAAWAQIYYHHSDGTNFFSSSTDALSSNGDYKYSVLGNVANYKNSSGKFEFMLEYPEYSLTQYNRWIQTGNPITEITPTTSEGTGVAGGYTPIHIDWTVNYWGGLNRTNGTSATFIDGGVGHNTWFYAIAPYGGWNNNTPGPNSYIAVGITRWWARIDDKTRTTKETLNARVGNITSNGTYYLHVKDNLGNITTKSFTISNVKDWAIEPPYVTAGASSSWGTSRTFTLSTPFSVDGITKYEYYISNSSATPANTVTATGNFTPATSFTTTSSGKYIFFRSINKNNLKSHWTLNNSLFIDRVAPTISSVTPSTTSDKTNYVTFTASDPISEISGYNVSTSTTAPTTWIPVSSFVETTSATKYAYSASWARVFHHNARGGTVLFTGSAEALSSNTDDKYSVLGNLNNYKNSSGIFEFLLEYPELSKTQYNRWKQTSNPATTSEPSGTGSEFAPGYQEVHIDWKGSYWGGLGRSTTGNTFIDGSYGHSYWYYAIGCYSKYNSGIPDATSSSSIADLWVRIDDKATTTSTSLTRRVGGLSTNGTYYLHVRDSVGNTTYKAFTVSKVA